MLFQQSMTERLLGERKNGKCGHVEQSGDGTDRIFGIHHDDPGVADLLFLLSEPVDRQNLFEDGIGQRVILADCDLRRPSLHTIFNLRSSPGFTDLMRDESLVAQVRRELGDEVVHVAAQEQALAETDVRRARLEQVLGHLGSDARTFHIDDFAWSQWACELAGRIPHQSGIEGPGH